MLKFLFIIVSVFVFPFNIRAQSKQKDVLKSKSFESLLVLYDGNLNDTITAKQIAQQYILKAKKVNDSTKIARGYSRLAFISRPHKALKYLDTVILFSKNSTHINFPAIGYLSKSQYYFNNNEYEKSLKNAILAYQSADKKNNIDQQLTALHQINAINELWGDYQKVLETEFFAYKLIYKNPETERFAEHYLYSVEGIGKCYTRLKKSDSALFYFKKGINASLKTQDSSTYHAFVSRTGMALYVKGNYKQALDSLLKGDIYREMFNKSYLPYFYYYTGSSYFNIGEKEKAVLLLRKVDSIYQEKHVLSPELPLVYDKLVSYYKSKNKKELELEYLYKLIQIERIINKKKSQIIDKTNTEYHIPKLLKEKEALISELNEQNQNYSVITYWVLGLLSISIFALIYYIRRQRQFKKRFELIVNKKPSVNKTEIEENSQGISIAIIEDILNKLNAFESSKDYLLHNLSLNDIAKRFNTNSSYLSKVINLKKDKNFSQYINDLRIDHTIQQLESDSKFRKYTIKAIAYESGFKSAESFSKCFYRKYGIYPSYYLKQLKQNKG